MLTIVMYHYVRDLPNTDYPEIKGLLTKKFDGQLDYLQKHYSVVDTQEVARAAAGEAKLPANACLLTFDDGFMDHYETVFPRLRERGLTGSFFPPACSALEHRMLDVHKIHFILASGHAPSAVKQAILEELETFRASRELPTGEELEALYAAPNRYDESDVGYIKNVLQKGLPQDVRSEITARLFARFVADSETEFAKKLYMSVPQMQEMIRAGMTFGGHGYRHNWLGTLPREEQREEIEMMLSFLETVYGRVPRDWVMCYPYGSYNEATLEIMKETGAGLGLTTHVGLVSDLRHPLELARLDTNDLPFEGSAPVAEWTRAGARLD